MDVLARMNVRIFGYDVVCGACGWTGRLTLQQADLLVAHHRPMIVAIDTSAGLWVCQNPRPLRIR